MRSPKTFIPKSPQNHPACFVAEPLRLSRRTPSTSSSSLSPRLAFGDDLANPLNLSSGFTLLEVLVVLGIFTILGTLGLIASMDMYRGFAFRNDRDMLVTVLQKARSESINNICIGTSCTAGQPHGIALEEGRYIVFQGTSSTTRDTSVDEIIRTQYGALVVGTGSRTEVVFKQLSGDVAATGTITLIDTALHTSVVSISSEGRVSWSN